MQAKDEQDAEHPAKRGTAARLKRGLGLAWTLLEHGIRGMGRHHSTQLAAGMAYYALFSVFPAAIVIAAGAGFVLDDPAARADAIDYLFRELPLSEDQGRIEIERLVDGVSANSGTLGVVGLVALLISASALMSAIRNSLAVIFEGTITRGALRGKGVDLALMLGLGLLFALSFVATLVSGLDIELTGGVGEAIETALTATGALLPIVLSAAVFAVLFRVLPTHHPPLRDTWPGVLFATVAYELVKRGFSFYLESFTDYSAVYGSIGAVIAFMFFVFVASVGFLLGAEIAAIWPAARAGAFESGPDDEPGPPFSTQVRDALTGLFKRNEADEVPIHRRR